MTRDRTGETHVVNVSAMEAQFSRKKKTDKHPHTNMAKAALNMMTRTSAPDYADHGIWMNSVDTGWITDEDPLHHVARKQREHDFFPPPRRRGRRRPHPRPHLHRPPHPPARLGQVLQGLRSHYLVIYRRPDRS